MGGILISFLQRMEPIGDTYISLSQIMCKYFIKYMFYLFIYLFVIRNQLMLLRRLITPKIFRVSRQAGDPEELIV